MAVRYYDDLETPQSGNTQSTATTIRLGTPLGGSISALGDRDPTRAVYRTESGVGEGWYRFVADKSGIVVMTAYNGSISVWQGLSLLGARWNGGDYVYLFQPVVKGESYTVRICPADAPSSPFGISRVDPAISTFSPVESVAAVPATPYGVATDLGDSVETVRNSTPNFLAELDNFTFDLPPIVPPDGLIDYSDFSEVIADVQFVIDGRDTSSDRGVPYAGNDGMSVSFISVPFGSFVWYWPYGFTYLPAQRRERWISLRQFATVYVVDLDDVVAGTILGQYSGGRMGIDRYTFSSIAGQGYQTWKAGTGLRVWWRVPDEDAMVRQYPLDNGQKMSTAKRAYPESGSRRVVGGFK